MKYGVVAIETRTFAAVRKLVANYERLRELKSKNAEILTFFKSHWDHSDDIEDGCV